MRILVVEDEPKLADVLRTYLEAAGYEVRCTGDGLEVMPLIEDWPPDMVLLDLMLPGRDGLELCRDIRARTAIPVIMVTAKTEEIDRLLGLELGADDYICKPYSPREVVARVKAVLRRSAADSAPAQARAQGGLDIDEGAWSARLDGVALDLTPVEFRLLALLSSQPGRIFSRDQVLDGLYDDRRIVTDRAVDSHIKNLRRKLAAVRPDEELIRSVYGVGYRLDLAGSADASP